MAKHAYSSSAVPTLSSVNKPRKLQRGFHLRLKKEPNHQLFSWIHCITTNATTAHRARSTTTKDHFASAVNQRCIRCKQPPNPQRDQLEDELGKEGGNDRRRSRGRGHTKDLAPKEARPKNSLEDLGKLARKTACKKIPLYSIVIFGLNEFHFVITHLH